MLPCALRRLDDFRAYPNSDHVDVCPGVWAGAGNFFVGSIYSHVSGEQPGSSDPGASNDPPG